MSPWDKEPCTLPIVTVGILSLFITATVGLHIIQQALTSKTNPSRKY